MIEQAISQFLGNKLLQEQIGFKCQSEDFNINLDKATSRLITSDYEGEDFLRAFEYEDVYTLEIKLTVYKDNAFKGFRFELARIFASMRLSDPEMEIYQDQDIYTINMQLTDTSIVYGKLTKKANSKVSTIEWEDKLWEIE